MKISQYNINFGNLDIEHVKLLQKQIRDGNHIPIRFYMLDGEQYIIDGGHAHTAYTNLGLVPPHIIEVKYTTPEDMMALSRHCNVNRIQQAPVSYARSIFNEIKLRLGINDCDVKTAIKRYMNDEVRGDKDLNIETEKDVLLTLDLLFRNEPIKPAQFYLTYLPLLNLPDEVKRMVDEGEIKKSHASEIAKIEDEEVLVDVARIVKEKDLSFKDTKELVEEVSTGKSTNQALQDIYWDHFTEMEEEGDEKQIELIKPSPIPDKKYRCIVIDPPWEMEKIEREVRPKQGKTLDYATMSIDEIKDEKKLPIRKLAWANGCHIYLWVTHKYLPVGLDLLKHWGVEYQCALTWVKPTGMTPYSFMYNTEHILFGRIGTLSLLKNGEKLSFEAPVTRHSEKPDKFYELIKKVSPAPRIDMFARKKHDGFEFWGNEVQKNE